jgi:hypothetical protein
VVEQPALAAPEAATERPAAAPFFITKACAPAGRPRLHTGQVDAMKPDEAHAILAKPVAAPAATSRSSADR